MMLTPLEPWIAAKIGRGNQPLSRAHLCSYQLEKLNATISLAQNGCPFYRHALGSRKIVLSSLGELADLPFTTDEQLSLAPLELLCVPPGEVSRIVTLHTSGTTGAPKRIFFTAEDQELTTDFFHWGMSTMVGPVDRVLILLPGSTPGSVGDLLKAGLARMDVEGIVHGPVVDPPRALQIMEKERVTALVGIPVQVLGLARLSVANRSQGSLGVRSVLLSTDHAPRAIVKAIEDAWSCQVYDHYGMTEMGLGGGVDCRSRTGYHLREADMLFEIVDPASGHPVSDGQWGEVVFSTLTRQAMPLIRYRTGDISRVIPEPCACGTVLKRLAHIDQRTSGDIDLPGGGTLRQKDFDEALFALEGIADFRVFSTERSDGLALALEIRYFDGAHRPSKEAVAEAVFRMAALSSETVRARVSLDISEWRAQGGVNRGTGKRRITNLPGLLGGSSS